MPTLRLQQLNLDIGGKTLCRDLSLSLSPGENWVVLGANGAGKTTLLHTIAGLRQTDDGEVYLDEHPLAGYAPRQRARAIGLLLQDYDSAFPITVEELLATARHPHRTLWSWRTSLDRARTSALLAQLDLSEFPARLLPTLSGGERRRVEIAALLIQDAPLCLVDEPTNHLDLHHQIQVMRLISERARRPGHINVIVLHDINLALRYASHVLLLFDNGDWMAGPVNEVISRKNLQRVYHCELQEIATTERRFYTPG